MTDPIKLKVFFHIILCRPDDPPRARCRKPEFKAMTCGNISAIMDIVNVIWSPARIMFETEPDDCVYYTDRYVTLKLDYINVYITEYSRVLKKDYSLGSTYTDQALQRKYIVVGEHKFDALVPDSYVSIARVLAHEFGHYLNLDHTHPICDPGNLMNPSQYRSRLLENSKLNGMQISHSRLWARIHAKQTSQTEDPSFKLTLAHQSRGFPGAPWWWFILEYVSR